jgi:hypothetical protein
LLALEAVLANPLRKKVTLESALQILSPHQSRPQ